MINRKISGIVICCVYVLCIAAILLLNGDYNDPGTAFYVNQPYSLTYETYSSNHVFSDELTMRSPVHGTIASEIIPSFQNEQDSAEGKTFATQAMEYSGYSCDTVRGKELYTAFCIYCHGKTGDGKGYLYSREKFGTPPASFASEKSKDESDSGLYYTISFGKGDMGSYKSQLKPSDRLNIIAWIRNLQQY